MKEEKLIEYNLTEYDLNKITSLLNFQDNIVYTVAALLNMLAYSLYNLVFNYDIAPIFLFPITYMATVAIIRYLLQKIYFHGELLNVKVKVTKYYEDPENISEEKLEWSSKVLRILLVVMVIFWFVQFGGTDSKKEVRESCIDEMYDSYSEREKDILFAIPLDIPDDELFILNDESREIYQRNIQDFKNCFEKSKNVEQNHEEK